MSEPKIKFLGPAFTVAGEPHGDTPEAVAVINEVGEHFKETVVEHRPGIDRLPVGTELVDRAHVTRLQAERDALQLLLNERDEQLDHEKRVSKIATLDAATLHQAWKAAEQRIDELTKHEREPVNWAAPKTVRQLIRQLQTLDPDLETHAMLRIPDFKDGKQVRSCPISISYERMEGPWLSSFKGDGRKVIAIWAKPDPRELQDQGETLTESAESR